MSIRRVEKAHVTDPCIRKKVQDSQEGYVVHSLSRVRSPVVASVSIRSAVPLWNYTAWYSQPWGKWLLALGFRWSLYGIELSTRKNRVHFFPEPYPQGSTEITATQGTEYLTKQG